MCDLEYLCRWLMHGLDRCTTSSSPAYLIVLIIRHISQVARDPQRFPKERSSFRRYCDWNRIVTSGRALVGEGLPKPPIYVTVASPGTCWERIRLRQRRVAESRMACSFPVLTWARIGIVIFLTCHSLPRPFSPRLAFGQAIGHLRL